MLAAHCGRKEKPSWFARPFFGPLTRGDADSESTLVSVQRCTRTSVKTKSVMLSTPATAATIMPKEYQGIVVVLTGILNTSCRLLRIGYSHYRAVIHPIVLPLYER
jgi:hypothetical protein